MNEIKTPTPTTQNNSNQPAFKKNDRSPRRARGKGGARKESGKGGRAEGGARREKVRPEFDSKMISIRRVARVVAGGRRFSFSVALVIGNKNGSVGVGTGKAGDTSLAIEKATRDAKKNMLKLKLTKTSSIPFDVMAKYSSATVKLYPTPGKGMSAGSAVRTVIELAGIKDIGAKILSGSKNQLNIARASVKALSNLI